MHAEARFEELTKPTLGKPKAEQSFVKQLNEAARECHDILIRKLCSDAAIEIDSAVHALHDCPSTENMQRLNCSWIRGVLVLAKATVPPDTPPRSGAGEVAELERKVA